MFKTYDHLFVLVILWLYDTKKKEDLGALPLFVFFYRTFMQTSTDDYFYNILLLVLPTYQVKQNLTNPSNLFWK